MNNVFVFDHPLIHHNLTIIRDKNTGHEMFARSADKIASLMAYEITKDIPVVETTVETPITTATTKIVAKETVIVPILRAGLGMVEGIKALIPDARVGHIGLYRDEETLQPKEYFCKMPPQVKAARVMVTDPMLATGGSAVKAIDMLKAEGVEDIILVSLVGAPEGIDAVHAVHPEVKIYLAALDEKLNEIGYIVPGLGDAGDRIFGTTE